MEELIKDLEIKKESLQIQLRKIEIVLLNLKELGFENPTNEKNRVNSVGNIRKHKKYERKKKKKWSREVLDFIKKNLDMSNKDLTEAVNKKFQIGTTEKSLGVQLSHFGIKRKKPGRDKDEEDVVHNKREEEEEEIDELDLDEA